MEAILTKNGRPVAANGIKLSGQCIDDVLDGKTADLMANGTVTVEISSGDSLRSFLQRKNNKDKGLVIRL